MLIAVHRDHLLAIPDRGASDPPTLASWIEYRAESSPNPWLAFHPDGTLAAACASMAAAQQALTIKEANYG